MKLLNPRRGASIDTKPHLIHISDVMESQDGSLLASLVRQGRILNLTEWKWVGREIEHCFMTCLSEMVICSSATDGRIVVRNRMEQNMCMKCPRLSMIWGGSRPPALQARVYRWKHCNSSIKQRTCSIHDEKGGQVEGSLIYVEFGTRSKTHRFLLGKKARYSQFVVLWRTMGRHRVIWLTAYRARGRPPLRGLQRKNLVAMF